MNKESLEMSLEKAFASALKERGLLTKIGYTRNKVANLKRNYKSKKITIDLMREVVHDAGFRCATKETWIRKSNHKQSS